MADSLILLHFRSHSQHTSTHKYNHALLRRGFGASLNLFLKMHVHFIKLMCHAPILRRKIVICTAFNGMRVPINVHKRFSYTTGGRVQPFTIEI